MEPALILALPLPALLIAAAVTDLRGYTIPNRISLALALGFLPFAALVIGWEPMLLLTHLTTGAGLFILGFGLWMLRAFGGGDVKLLAAAGLWFGWPQALAFVTVMALAGGMVALALLALRRERLRALIPAEGPLSRLADPGKGVPYALPMAIAGCWVFADWLTLFG